MAEDRNHWGFRGPSLPGGARSRRPAGRGGLLDGIPFHQISDLLGEITLHLGDTLRRAQPSKASIELGLEFGLENGQLVALIARGSGKANLKIAMEWEKPDPAASHG